MRPMPWLRWLRWLRARDAGLVAMRRAARTAIVMPALFALGDKVIRDSTVATFAAFGAFALLLLVDFGGPMRERLLAQAALSLAGGVLIAVATVASRDAWLAAGAMAVVGFGVLFAGVVSSVLASATATLLLAFILSVSLPGSAGSIPARLAGWGLASAAAWVAVAVLWPAPARYPLRRPAAAAGRALAHRLRVDVARATAELDGTPGPSDAERDEAVQGGDEAVAALRRAFLATPYRPTGLSTADRAVVRLVDEIGWLAGIVAQSAPHPRGSAGGRGACAVKSASATVLERSADLLDTPSGPTEPLQAAMTRQRETMVGLEDHAALELPVGLTQLVTSLEPSFRALELTYAVSQIATNVGLAAAAERRGWLDRILGRQPAGLAGPLSAAQERAAAHVERHSVWLHNSLRGAAGLGLAVLVAGESGVQHSFWVVLGTLSVLRSKALNTGTNVLRGLLGTIAGFVVGAALLAAIGSSSTILWSVLPLAVLVAGIAPAAISFAAGQAAFTLTVVILFNLIQPVGWRVGLLRVEDVALGCAVSLVVGLLFWPRGAAAAMGRALAEAYSDTARYVAGAVDFGLSRCDSSGPGPPAPVAPLGEAVRAAAASRRLDDTFRSYLAEGGSKPVPLAQVATLVTGVVGLRLAADAVLDLWQREDGTAGGDRTAARAELLDTSARVTGWYAELAASLLRRSAVPDALGHDGSADGRLVEAVRSDLQGGDGRASGTAVRMIWTGDHLDAVRRLQATLVDPARAAIGRGDRPG